ncbi:MAG: hypothetical protein GX638_06630 [Crenarchaeota archaeon]|nr:hypothetical protein [Thermoproteota archaeon]
MSDEGLQIGEMWMAGVDIDPEDLRIIARIICETRQKKSLPASFVIPHKTELVKSAAKKYLELLERYGVLVVCKTGGMEFRLREK